MNGRDDSPTTPPTFPTAATTGDSGTTVPPRALVIGGAKRVGRAICLELARQGCEVVFTYNTSAVESESLLRELRAIGGGRTGTDAKVFACHRLNLAEASERWAELDAVVSSGPCWDVLVLSASVYEPCALNELSRERLVRDYTVNAIAPAMIARAMAPRLSKSTMPGGGSMVIMGDVHAMGPSGRPRTGFLSYSMSKSALTELALSLSRALAPSVRVNVVAPGVVAFPESGPESDRAEQQRYLSRVPMARPGTPEEAAKAVAWLALAATYTTGQVLRVDGGRGVV